MKITVKLNDQELPVLAEIITSSPTASTFAFIGSFTLGSMVFKDQFVTKRYLNSEFEVIK